MGCRNQCCCARKSRRAWRDRAMLLHRTPLAMKLQVGTRDSCRSPTTALCCNDASAVPTKETPFEGYEICKQANNCFCASRVKINQHRRTLTAHLPTSPSATARLALSPRDAPRRRFKRCSQITPNPTDASDSCACRVLLIARHLWNLDAARLARRALTDALVFFMTQQFRGSRRKPRRRAWRRLCPSAASAAVWSERKTPRSSVASTDSESK